MRRFSPQCTAALVGGILHARRQSGAAVIAPEALLRTEQIDVAADGLRRDVEMLGQRLDGDEAPLAHEI
jgi:hypothetical protein